MYLTPEQKSKYKILSREKAEKYCLQKHVNSSVIISIKSVWDKVSPALFCNENNKVKAILTLSFDDVDFEEDPNSCMTVVQGKQIASFVNRYFHCVDTIIIHCDGGISRSAGVCAAIMRVKEGDDSPVFNNRNKYPNMTCYLMTLKGFGYI